MPSLLLGRRLLPWGAMSPALRVTAKELGYLATLAKPRRRERFLGEYQRLRRSSRRRGFVGIADVAAHQNVCGCFRDFTKSMAKKELLKRLVFVTLVRMPAEITAGMLPPRPPARVAAGTRSAS